MNPRNITTLYSSATTQTELPATHLCLFEAPIDMLSFISIHQKGWKNHSYAACCGVSDRVLWQMMADNPQIDSVYLCLDNDEAG